MLLDRIREAMHTRGDDRYTAEQRLEITGRILQELAEMPRPKMIVLRRRWQGKQAAERMWQQLGQR